THNLHNIYPIRGAQVRDANAWAKYIDEARDRYASEADVVFAQHHWPVWGNARIMDYLAKQRDAYKYLHDQTLRLINHGLKATEIAEQLTMPQSLENTWSVRGYYGTLSHNAKSIYQRYIGWYDANPAHLNPLPPSERGAKLVDYVGGEAAVMAKAREDFDRGEYRWVAEIMNEVIFANPANQEARHLAADALEQLGYQAESATWRNAYLQGAHELRNGVPQNLMRAPISADVVQALTVPLFFDYLAVRLNGPKAEGQHLVINWVFPDLAERYTLTLENCALTYMAGKTADHAHVTVTLARPVLSQLVLQQITLTDAIHEGAIALEGDGSKLSDLFELIDEFRFMFHILEPRQEP
ncbi:MAG: metallo-beta-lactamase, partial [Candidatus Entotheonella factor]